MRVLRVYVCGAIAHSLLPYITRIHMQIYAAVLVKSDVGILSH